VQALQGDVPVVEQVLTRDRADGLVGRRVQRLVEVDGRQHCLAGWRRRERRPGVEGGAAEGDDGLDLARRERRLQPLVPVGLDVRGVQVRQGHGRVVDAVQERVDHRVPGLVPQLLDEALHATPRLARQDPPRDRLGLGPGPAR
jgi:hypothetical protein